MSNTFNIVGPPASSPTRVSAGWRAAERVEPPPAPPEADAGPRRAEAPEAAATAASLAATAINAVIVTPPAGAPVGASSEAGRNNGALATRALQSYRAVDDTPKPRTQPSQTETSGALTSRSGRLMAVTSNQDQGPAPLNVFLDALARAFSSANPTLAAVPPAAEPGAAAPAARSAAADRASAPPAAAPPPPEQRAAQRQLQAYAEAGPTATPAAAVPSRVDA